MAWYAASQPALALGVEQRLPEPPGERTEEMRLVNGQRRLRDQACDCWDGTEDQRSSGVGLLAGDRRPVLHPVIGPLLVGGDQRVGRVVTAGTPPGGPRRPSSPAVATALCNPRRYSAAQVPYEIKGNLGSRGGPSLLDHAFLPMVSRATHCWGGPR